MKKKSILSLMICVAFAAGIVLAGTASVSADSQDPPDPWSVMLDGGNRIFYRTPEGDETETQLKTGLYYNVVPPVNIYYVEGDLWLYDVSTVFSDDGIYFAHFPWALGGGDYENPDLGGQAIGFFKNGSLIKSYIVGDLLKDATKAEFSASHVWWENSEKRKFNAKKNVLTVVTLDKLVYHFDIATGAMLDDDQLEAILAGPDVTSPGPYVTEITDDPTTTEFPLPDTADKGATAMIPLMAAGLAVFALALIPIRKRETM